MNSTREGARPARWHLTITFALLAATIGACNYLSGRTNQGYSKPSKFNYQDQVGFAKVSNISAARWEDVQDGLAPNFNMTSGDQALNQVALTALTEAQSNSRITTGSLSIQFNPGGGGQVALTNPSSAASPVPTAPLAAASPQAIPSLLIPQINTTPVPIAASTRYDLAASLFYEVKMLNAYVQYASRRAHDVPFLVTLDVSLFPYTPAAAVNAQVLISFAGIDKSANVRFIPEVVPIILSEDIQTEITARNTERAVSTALTAAGGYGPILGQANLADVLHTISEVNGVETNTLQLVGAAGMGNLIVRFGAGYSPTYQYALMPQTRRIHCLVLIKKPNLQSMRPPQGSDDDDDATQLFVLANTDFHTVDLPKQGWSLFSRQNAGRIDVRPADDKFAMNGDLVKADLGIDLRSSVYLFPCPNPNHVQEPSQVSALAFLFHDYSARNIECFSSHASDIRDQMPSLPAVPVLWAEMAKIGVNSSWSNSLVPLPITKDDPLTNTTLLAFHHLVPGAPGGTANVPMLSVLAPSLRLSNQLACWHLEILPKNVTVFPDSITLSGQTYQFGFQNLADTQLEQDLMAGTQRAVLHYDDERCPHVASTPIAYSIQIIAETPIPSNTPTSTPTATPTPTPTPTATATPTPTATSTPHS